MLGNLLVQGRRPPFPTRARSASHVQNVRCIRDHRSTRVSRSDLIVRPEGLEPPTTWFEVTRTNSTYQLKQSLVTLAAFVEPTQIADFLFHLMLPRHKPGTFVVAKQDTAAL